MNFLMRRSGHALLLLAGFLMTAEVHAAVSTADAEFFESRIRPVLAEHCFECHSSSAKALKGGLRLDTIQGIRAGGDSGELFSDDPQRNSRILEAVRYEELEMPPSGRLPDAVIRDFEEWARLGAPLPANGAPESADQTMTNQATSALWSFAPLLPRASIFNHASISLASSPVDALIQARLNENRLKANPRANAQTLLRRLYFDTQGLPPPPEFARRYASGMSANSYLQEVDRALASPAFGERWGRRWLDLARYADTNGADENMAMPQAWRYRDYVIDSLNADKPYDQFIIEQLAGDLLAPSSDESIQSERLIATGFLALGPKMLAEQDKEKMILDIVDEQITVTSRAFLGLSMECARCHDHKFDPIETEDYYAMAGVFRSSKTMANTNHVSRWVEKPLPSAKNQQATHRWKQRLEDLQSQIQTLKEHSSERERLEDLQQEHKRLKSEGPHTEKAMVVLDGTPTNLPVHVRGNHLNLKGDPIPRGAPDFWSNLDLAPEIPAHGSGRLELARWIAHPKNPLTARVVVNRIWQGYFGAGLVATPSDFGRRGADPTHPKLLDFLARELIEGGWRLKRIHRLILESEAYQRSSRPNEIAESLDPENRWLWRRNRRRLEAEPIRDALLAVSNQLQTAADARIPQQMASDNGYYRHDPSRFNATTRAVYLPIVRARNYEMFSTFDYVNASASVGARSSTIAPQQALFMMNSEEVETAAQAIAMETLREAPDLTTRIERVFYRLFSRAPRPSENELIRGYLEKSPSAMSEQEQWTSIARALLGRNEFIFIP